MTKCESNGHVYEEVRISPSIVYYRCHYCPYISNLKLKVASIQKNTKKSLDRMENPNLSIIGAFVLTRPVGTKFTIRTETFGDMECEIVEIDGKKSFRPVD